MKKTKNTPTLALTHSEILIIIAIFLIALFLRLYKLGTILNGFHVDELNAGYVGRYIFLHGKDIFGSFLPIYFNKFGDYRPTGIFYLSGLSTFIFGINAFAVRFPSAFFGALSIYPLFLIVKKISGKKSVGFLAAGALAILPWHIVLSRATSESIIGLFFLLTGINWLYNAIERNTKRSLIYAALSLTITYCFYHSYRVIVPLLVLAIAVIGRSSNVKKHLWWLAIFFFALTFGLGLTKFGSGRLNQVIFYKNPTIDTSIVNLVSGDKGIPLMVSRIFHNKPYEYLRALTREYLFYYSPDYLFMYGGYPDRYRVPQQGLLYISFLPILLLGFLTLLRDQERLSWKLFLLFFLIVAPIPAAITYEDIPNVQRSVTLMIPLLFFISSGFDACLTGMKNKKIILLAVFVIFTPILLYETGWFWHSYSQHASAYKSPYHNDGNRELFDVVKAHYQQSDNISLPLYDELPMYAAFYLNIFDNFPTQTYSGSPTIEHVAKFIFVNTRCPLTSKTTKATKQLYINEDSCSSLPDWVTQIATIQRSDSTIVYNVYWSK